MGAADAPPGPLERAAQDAAGRHAEGGGRPAPIPALARARDLPGWFSRHRRQFAATRPVGAKASEWLLDNEYLIARAARQVAHDLPPGFYRRLRALGGADGGAARVWDLARTMLQATRLQVSRQTVTQFVEVYQRTNPLLIAELWALPTCLRLACLEQLAAAVVRLDPSIRPPFPVDGAPAIDLEDAECVGRAVSNLRVIASIPWKDVFCALSRVEAILAGDPAGAYARMDFASRDGYRRAVEAIARRSPATEIEVAERAVESARRAAAVPARESHVGYWLVAEGRRPLERMVASRPPRRRRVVRWAHAHARWLYAASLVAAIATIMVLPVAYLVAHDAGPAIFSLGVALILLPASVLGITVVQWLVTQLVAPRTLCKLDLDTGIPPDCRTAVVVPSLAGTSADVAYQLDRLETHYLANPDPGARFVLLSDFPDAPEARMPADAEVVDALVAGVERLNERYPGRPFHALHRSRQFNPAEGVWMGWERKRGKLEQFNQLLSGADPGAFTIRAGDTAGLEGIRFVVTLDVDTVLPQGTLARLVGTLAHPLNQAVFDDVSGRVLHGYTVIQPRIEISPQSGTTSLFARWFTGDTAIDIYSRAVSDVYQDLFGSGIYVGKGAYDVAAFRRSVEGRVPDNALASHDLFEGIHGRVALASDIVLYEDFPRQYLEFSRRQHRWIRGDWQLLPWLRRTVPGTGGQRFRNRLSGLDRWKIADNLRRSLLTPCLVLMFLAGWLVLPGHPAVWTGLGVLAPGGHLFTDIVTGFARGRRRRALSDAWQRLTDPIGRWGLLLLFLPYDAHVATDAIARTLARLLVTRRHLLQWTSAAATARLFGDSSSRRFVWRAMWVAPASAVAAFAAILVWRPDAALPASPLLLLWLSAPEVAWRLGRPRRRPDVEPLGREDREWLRLVARRTWRFFETFAGPDDQWLPPDNFQEMPRGEVAHRTSPTNVGMLLLSSLAASDLGYLDPVEFASRTKNTLDTLDALARHRGHFFNWYDTRTLEPLAPHYVSTVDSGNLAMSLLAVKQGCLEISRRPAVRPAQWDGLHDALRLLRDAARGLPLRRDAMAAVLAPLDRLEQQVTASRRDPSGWCAALRALGTVPAAAFDRALLDALGDAGGRAAADLHRLRDVRTWVERVTHHVRSMQRQMDELCPWLGALAATPPSGRALADAIAAIIQPTTRLVDLAERCRLARERVAASRPDEGRDESWEAALVDALDRGARVATALHNDLLRLAARADAMAWAMDFRPLYDPDSRLFRIGYDASADRLDTHHYDLLASEARASSLLAIAKGDVPVEHWFHLGRPVTAIRRRRCLISWGGSMFEYLMPSMLLRSEPGTLLAESERAAIDAQTRHADRLGIPWGMSESGFAAIDANQTYQYRSFGVPALGLRRGIAADAVVAPYASLLAVAIAPRAAVANARRLDALGLLGEFGFYEAADFTPERTSRDQPFIVVRSYMAHHQGMILAAIDNALCGQAMLRRLAAESRLHAVSLLLHERVPSEIPPEVVAVETPAEPEDARAATPVVQPWRPRRQGAFPEVLLLGNGRLSSWMADSGAGRLRWQGWALTRGSDDPVLDDAGVWVYLRDEESGERWSVTRQPCGGPADAVGVTCSPGLAEFHRRWGALAVRMDVAVAPVDDIEVRIVTLVNDEDRPRRLTVTTCAEVVLAPPAQHERHPVFSRLFVHSEHVPHVNGVCFTRRPRDPAQRPPVMMHWFASDDASARWSGVEADRAVFLGRGNDWRHPDGVMRPPEASTGFTLDPLMALRAAVDVGPGATVRLAFLTAVAGSRESATELAERYQTMGAIDWLLSDATAEGGREIARLGIDPAHLPALQTIGSLLVYDHRALRPPTRQLAENVLGQPQLWGLSVSGDLPLLVIRQHDPDDVELVRTLAGGQALWRRRGLPCDLLVLNERASGYEHHLVSRVRGVLQEIGARDRFGAEGGVRVVNRDQVGPEIARLLLGAAHVVLDTRGGTVGDQASGAHRERPAIPRFVPSSAPMTAEEPAVPRPGEPPLRFDNGLGGFSPDGREYVIRLGPDQRTPAPWVNVLAGETAGALVSESGLGYTWAANAGEHRLSPWSNDPVGDQPAEALYLRDEESGAMWSPTPLPAGARCAHEVRHGFGRTSWRSLSHGLDHRMDALVSPDEPVKIVHLRLRNTRDATRRLTATFYVEWVLGTTPRRAGSVLTAEYEPSVPAILARNPWTPEFADRVAFLCTTDRVHGFTMDRDEFLGREGSPARPAALERWGLSDTPEPQGRPCAALQVHLELGPQAETDVAFVLGSGVDRDHAVALAAKYRDRSAATATRARVERFWSDRLGTVQVETPDEAMNLVLNGWLLYQALASRMLGRTGFYQSSGAMGFRDQLQDGLALTLVEPGRLRAHLLECARRQFEEGDVLHWWHPPSGRGVRTRCSDDLLWLPFATAHYVAATGDEAVLDEVVPFLRGRALRDDESDLYGTFEASASPGTLLEHCERALEHGVTRGRHDLPLIGAGDWTDGMNRLGIKGRGESVWLGWFAIATMERFAVLCRRRADDERARRWQDRSAALSRALDTHAWDGQWYLRAFDDEGVTLGSSRNAECRIDSIAQSWAILSGAGQAPRAAQAVASARRLLVDDAHRVVRLLDPPFAGGLRDPGYIGAYPPGIRENGGQYTHAAIWLGWALADQGDGDGAAALFDLLNPVRQALTADDVARYRVEPYVVAADIGGTAPHVGRGGWTWYTGSAAWLWRFGVERLVGIQPAEGGVRIAPCLPRAWRRVRATIRTGAGTLEIEIDNPDAGTTDVAEVLVDGRRVDGDVIPLPGEGRTHRVSVRLGAPAGAMSDAGAGRDTNA